MTDMQLIIPDPNQQNVVSSYTEDRPIVGVSPKRLFYGVVSAGFYYNLKFSIQNNSLAPIRIRLSCTPFDGEKNTIRVVYLPDKIASGMSVQLTLELTAEFVASSMFTLQVSTSADPRIYSRLVEANVISPDTFKYVKKSLTLQKRPIYRSNVTSVGPIMNLNGEAGGGSVATPVTSFSETLIMDEEDIEDLTSLPMAQNIYWDPFSKMLRIDPDVGRVLVDKTITVEESIERTKLRRKQRIEELEEQGFYTLDYIRKCVLFFGFFMLYMWFRWFMTMLTSVVIVTPTERLKEGFPHVHSTFDTDANEGEEEGTVESLRSSAIIEGDDNDHDNFSRMGDQGVEDGMMSSRTSSNSHRTSVSSMMALKREKIEKLRRATISAANSFSENTKKDSMVNSMRTLNMIQGRQNHSPSKRDIPT